MEVPFRIVSCQRGFPHGRQVCVGSAFPFGWLRGGEGTAELQAEPRGLRSVGDEHNRHRFGTPFAPPGSSAFLSCFCFPSETLICSSCPRRGDVSPISAPTDRTHPEEGRPQIHSSAHICRHGSAFSSPTALPHRCSGGSPSLPSPQSTPGASPSPALPTYGAEGAAGSDVKQPAPPEAYCCHPEFKFPASSSSHLAGGRALSTNSNMPSGLGVSSQPLSQNPERGVNRGTSVLGPRHSAPRAPFHSGTDQSSAALWVKELPKLSPEKHGQHIPAQPQGRAA